MKKFVLYLLCCFFLIIVESCKENTLPYNNFSNYLFINDSMIKLNLINHIDFIGIDPHGSTYEFFEYQVKDLDTQSLHQNFPKFDSIFLYVPLVNKNFSYWTKTPIKDTSSYYFKIATSSNMDEREPSREFIKKEYLLKTNNFYSYIGAYPIGNFLLVYSPAERKLFIIYKK